MKKYTAILGILVAALVLAGLFTRPGASADGELSIVATIFPEYDWVMEILGDRAESAQVTLLLDSGGRRLSKRDGDESLEHLQQRYTPEQIIGRLAYVCGLQKAPDPRTPAELADRFAWELVPQTDIVLPEGLF